MKGRVVMYELQCSQDPPCVQRFWMHVTRTETCWLWTGATNRHGYGVVSAKRLLSKRHVFAHRFAYVLQHGPIPMGLHVLHHCDTPACVRGDHLYAGTQADNVRDMLARGRARYRTGHIPATAVLQATQAAAIRAALAAGAYQVDLAHQYGVSHRTISVINLGQTWRDPTCTYPIQSAPHKNRPQCGADNNRAKLTPSSVATIRARHAAGGITRRALAAEYGVSATQIGDILSNKSWIMH